MSTMTLDVSEPVKAFAKERAQNAGFGDTSAYVEELIRRDRLQAAKARLVEELRKGINGPWIRGDDAFIEDVRAEIAQRVKVRFAETHK